MSGLNDLDFQELQEAIALMVCELYTGDVELNQPAIAQEVQRHFGNRLPERFSLRDVRPYLAIGRKKGFLQVVPPLSESMAEDIAIRFDLHQSELLVVNSEDSESRWSSEHVPSTAAELVAELAQQLWDSRWPKKSSRQRVDVSEREPIRIGLGPGRATFDFSRHFSMRIRRQKELPPLELVAISAGCPASSPQFAPPSFFNFFPEFVKFTGLFGETLVRSRDLPEISERPGVKEAFAKKDSIDIVVTSMGDPRDEHDLLTTFLKGANVPIPEPWAGNVQYRPYTKDEFYTETPDELRALTVFELSDFQTMIAQQRHVVLLVRQCGRCPQGTTRARALAPLMQPKMKVWSRCVMDVRTARDLSNL